MCNLSRLILRIAAQLSVCCGIGIAAFIVLAAHAQPQITFAYSSYFSNGYVFTLLDLNTCTLKDINFSQFAPSFDWSQLGEQITVIFGGRNYEIYIMDDSNFLPISSPDATRMIYMSNNFSQLTMLTVAPDSGDITDERTLLQAPAYEMFSYADWINDTQLIIATSTLNRPMQFSILTLPASPSEALINTPIDCTIDHAFVSVRP